MFKTRFLVLVAILALSAPRLAFAGNYIDNAASVLKNSGAYVVPGTEGTDSSTVLKLQSVLTDGDKIALVMLPASAEDELGMDINTIAATLSDKLGNKRIIGLSVGNMVLEYAPTLPSGVASDQMRRAKNVSNNNPVTILITYAQNIRDWQKAHPEPQTSPLDPTGEGGMSWAVWISTGFIVLLAVSFLYIFLGGSTEEEEQQKLARRTRFNAHDQINDLLSKIAVQRDDIKDIDLQATITKLCADVEKYFQTCSKDKMADAITFQGYLQGVTSVLSDYIKVQGSKDNYRKPADILQRGKSSIISFADYVRDAVIRGHEADLLDFNINTKILEAQGYRSGQERRSM
ncbi:MAG: hypothetical protein HZC02_00725 [Candidatus Levybacteria bacterium]|nr:hypothetical protein [Candidatus Levybacteria bacterium]